MHVMIDLETFGTSSTAAIVSIGAVAFELDKPFDEQGKLRFYANVSLQSSVLAGMTIDSDTVDWWRRQSKPAQRELLDDVVSLSRALEGFTEWYVDCIKNVETVWSHGATFDIPVMEIAFRLHSMSTPWSYRQPRDTRTLFWIAKRLGWVQPQHDTMHIASHDASDQARDVCSAYAHIKDATNFKQAKAEYDRDADGEALCRAVSKTQSWSDLDGRAKEYWRGFAAAFREARG